MVAVEKEDRPPSAKSSSAGVLTTEALQNLEVIHSQKRWLKDLVTEMAELDVSSTQSPPPCAREIGVNSNASSPSQSPAFARSGSRASTANNDPTPETAISSRKRISHLFSRKKAWVRFQTTIDRADGLVGITVSNARRGGVHVDYVVSIHAAARAGLRCGDIITLSKSKLS